MSFNSASSVSFHRVYMKEAELRINTGSVQLSNSTRVEISTLVEIIANFHVKAKFFNSGRIEIKGLHCRILGIALWGITRPSFGAILQDGKPRR